MRKVGEFLERYPLAESILELVFSLFFNFAPIFVAAFLAISRRPEFDAAGFEASFISFFAKGELSLVALGVCGSILFIIVFKPNSASTSTNAIFALLVTLGAFVIGAIVGDNPGFEAARPTWLLQVILILYVLLNLAWLFMSIKSKRVDFLASAESTVNRADNIISQSRSRGGR
ncbi:MULTISPECIES: hypothetical protein [unclassified Aureimonas]|uniref:hypothetical protein n=1 Tax=unclassified Aureimonas TaxID=2615206 RepID=UPI0012E3DB95|nr:MULTISPECIES: hypothetical protein [unclassified Aureimonas]